MGGRAKYKKIIRARENEMKKNSCMPINPKKYSYDGLKKIHTRNLITKKNSCGSKIPLPPPPITFLMVRPLWEIVASSPFPCPSRLCRSLERSRETRFSLAQIRELARRLYVLSVMQAPVFFVTIEACIKSDIKHKAQVLSHPRSQGRTTSRSLDNLLKDGTYLHTSKWHFPFPTRNFYVCLTNVYQSLSLLNFCRVARARFDPGPTDVQSPT